MDGKGAQCPVHDARLAQDGGATPARFDAAADRWILSSYADVQAAFHEPNLCPVDSHGNGPLDGETRASSAQTRMQALAALPAGRLAEWQAEFEPIAATIATALPLDRAIDVLGEFARPWSLALAVRVSGAAPEDVEHLAALAARVTIATACPEDASLKPAGDAANNELNAALANGNQPMPGPAFVALSQTVPCLLANTWLILLRAPYEIERVRANGSLTAAAVEELLRRASLVRSLHRRAAADLQIGDLLIKRGQRVELMVESANHDPEYFPDPHSLNLSRKTVGHFALGAGSHSCAAASLIRMAIGIATRVLVAHFDPAEDNTQVTWRGGSGFRWPAPLYARRLSA